MFNVKAIGVGAVILVYMLIGIGGATANCDNSSLSGSYSLRVNGFAVGVFDSSGTLHSFAAL